ncbi:increased loss of mitochondrial DNA protein 1 [Xylariaceae sp. FL0016]|nr:increased loss of mitochondrial DNA protein 1 [Xylariaceae sp. FL0016]
MALISTSTILTSLCLFHITLAFFFYTNPSAIADQALVWVLGETLGMPRTTHFSAPSPASSFLAVALFLTGLSDLITLSMPEEIWLVHYWGAVAPARLTVFGLLTVFSWATAPSSNPFGIMAARFVVPGVTSGGDGLRNRVFFAFAFLETISWIWVWVTLREEAMVFSRRKRRRASSSAK